MFCVEILMYNVSLTVLIHAYIMYISNACNLISIYQ